MPRRFRLEGDARSVKVSELSDLANPARQEVIRLTNGRCAVPRCPAPIRVAVRPIADPSVQELQVGVCSIHGSLAKEGVLPAETFLTISRLLLNTQTRAGVGATELSSRRSYLQAIADRLERPTAVFLAAYVGPLPLHPEWYHQLRDDITSLPNMDRGVQKILLENRIPDLKIVFRNVERYAQKVNELVAPSLHQRLKEDILINIDKVWGVDGEKGPPLCCLDTGIFHIPTIFDDCAVTATRDEPSQPIYHGLLVTDSILVRWETQAFERLFSTSFRGQATEVFQLREYVKSL